MSKPSILVVDDTAMNIDILVDLLGEDYDVSVAMDGESALDLASQQPPMLILLDIMMPGIDGYEVCQRLKANKQLWKTPVIFLTAMTEDASEERGLALGAVDYITKPFKPALVKARVDNHIALKRHQDHLETMVAERTRELQLTQQVTFESLATLAEYRDPETGGHIRRTQNYVRILAEALSNHPKYEAVFTQKIVDIVYQSAPLHDIGKVGVPDHILLKPGKLTDEEFEQIKKHTNYGRDAIAAAERSLGSTSFLKIAREIAESHHEKWDGSGYPSGASGEEISIFGRIMAIADVYDALISKRVYKPAFCHAKAVRIILEGRGTHFDPDLIDIFAELHLQFRDIGATYADSEEEREALLTDECP
jgi:putative two-component system response regulator